MTKNHLSGSGKQNWYTPEYIINSARNTMGGDFHLDPASSKEANKIVKAHKFITLEEDALNPETRWRNDKHIDDPIRIWMNPPYSRGIMSKFINRLIKELTHLHDQAIVIVNSDTGTSWYQLLLRNSSAICHFNRRVSFIDGDTMEMVKGNNYSQTVFYFGSNVEDFQLNFNEFGIISKSL